MQASILFVCTGNICRSPTAEGLFRLRTTALGFADTWRCDSAGIHAQMGQEPEPLAIEIAALYGANIRALKSRPFEREDFAQFDLIVAMDYGHLDFLTALRPANYRGRITLLETISGQRFEVMDPYGRSRSAYVRAGRDIEVGIECLIQQLAALGSSNLE
jgi:protein-tyrosine phosphatase